MTRVFLGGVGARLANGGEEFLSYMNLAESLAVTGDEAWRRWDSGMTENLNRVQNADGSWTGSHCITGRTFCTAAVLLTLMADRTPVPVPARATTSVLLPMSLPWSPHMIRPSRPVAALIVVSLAPG